jgi:ATP-dependent helicase/nuclease subunit A
VVTLWRPIGMAVDDEVEEETEEGGANWLSRPEREMAERIALQIKHWVTSPTGFPLVKGRNRAAPMKATS